MFFFFFSVHSTLVWRSVAVDEQSRFGFVLLLLPQQQKQTPLYISIQGRRIPIAAPKDLLFVPLSDQVGIAAAAIIARWNRKAFYFSPSSSESIWHHHHHPSRLTVAFVVGTAESESQKRVKRTDKSIENLIPSCSCMIDTS